MYSEFVDENKPQKEAEQVFIESHKLLQKLTQVSANERKDLLITYIQEQIAKAVGISASELDVEQSLNYMGIDSLIAVKLRNQLRTDLEVDIPVVKFMEDSNIINLATQVSEQILCEDKEDLSRSEDFNPSQSYPLSHGQQGLWFLYKLAPQSAAYNIAFTARICSHLNVAALQRAFQALIVRHPTLRSTFGQRDGEPFQEVHESQELCFETIDASTWNSDELTTKVIEAYKRPFNLERGSVLRVSLFTRSTQDYVLLLTIHHIAVDGFSFGIILNELRLLYESEDKSSPSYLLASSKQQYKNFVQWQRHMLASPVGENLWVYWQKQLAGELPVLKLPTDRPRPPIQSYEGASHTFEVSKELTFSLRAIAKAEGATLYMVLLTAFQVLLHRYTGQEDIIVGSPTEGRSQSEFASTVGFFVNMLALRANLAGNPTFSKLLSQVRQTVLAALTHQDYPSPMLSVRSQVNRDPSLPGLFRVSFNLLKLQEMAEDYELSISTKTHPREDWGGLRLEPFVIPQQEGQNDIVFDMMETTESLTGILRYNTDLFDSATISRMADHFQVLLKGIIADRNQEISLLSLLTEAEQHHLLVERNNNQIQYPHDKCIHHLFEAQVKRTPDAVAVTFKDQQLTYQELNNQANQLARYLQKLGVRQDVLVGICVERSLLMVVGLLGILKAGGAYVPLDPAYPKEHLNFMLEDAQVSVLLTQESLVESLPEQDTHLVLLDKDWEIISQESEANLLSGATLQNLAYVIYTSGSTGKSKGVMIAHSSLVNAYWAWEKAYQLSSVTSHLQMASFSFDVFSGDLIRALCSGAKLVLCPREWLLEPENLYQLMLEEKIDSAEFVPVVLRNLVQYLTRTNQNLHFMRLLIIGSDSLYVQEYEEFRRFCGSDTRLINSYGVTEATIDSTYFENRKVNLSVDGLVPIGSPFANTQIYILDPYLQPVPIGVTGEVYIGGAGVAKGYLNRPDLTSEKFISNPFKERRDLLAGSRGTQDHRSRKDQFFSSERLYKTGDLARYLCDGNIEFLGRIDNQVKVRGFRIELGEIEAVLSTHPQVREAVVMTREEQVGNKSLVGYIVPYQESLSTRELRNFVKQKLPEYMVPSAFVELEDLPLTPNGKVDRRALPAPDRSQYRFSEFVPPRTSTEDAIANIFASVLRLEQVGIYDNFFELGGHSLLATQVVSRLQQAFNVEFPLRRLLESPTVDELNQTLLEYLQLPPAQQSFPVLPKILPAPEQRYQPFPLTDIQQAYWLGRNEAFELGNIAAHGYLELDCHLLNLESLNHAWQKLVLRHDMLRAVVLPDGQQQILQQVPLYEIEVLDLCGQPPEAITTQLEMIRHQMSHEVLPADQWPLFKLRATRLDNNRTRLHLSFDALIGDALSMFVILREWSELYRNPESLLPPLELSFRDYVVAELALQATPQYHLSQEYWFTRIDTLPPAPELPLAQNPGSITKPQFKRRSAKLSPEQWQKLKDQANQVNLTPSGVLLSAFAEILTRWSKSPKFTINLTLFHRLPLHPQVNELVGDFTSLTLLEIDNSLPNSFTTRAQQIQQQLWQDLDHGYVSGLEIQRELSRRRGSYQFMPVVFTSTLGLDSLSQNASTLSQLGEVVYSLSQTPQVWLDHQVTEQNGTLVFNWDVVEELFPQGFVDDMFEAYCNFLEQLASKESAWVEIHTELLLQSQVEKQTEVNNTAAPVSEQTLHSLFINQVEARSQSPAVITPNRTLTYGELYHKANQLGHRLRQLGATTNTLVAVILEKGWEQIVAVLGILMSGAAYLPIDLELPQERQWYLLEQGEVKLAVTQPHLNLPSDLQCLYVESEDSGVLYSNPLESVQTADDLAYVIYTSGSTGLPKGVMITHRGAVNTILDINERFGVKPSERVLALSALNFDLSVYDIFGVLAAGGTIVVPAKEGIKDPAHWLELMVSEQVSLWNSVPALMQMLVEYLFAQPEKARLSLRLALLSGDWLPLSLPIQIQALWSNVAIASLGGATEASIWSICYPIKTVDPNWKSIPYGQPLKNQRFYVFNELMEPTPIWVSGQLYIGGIGLAKGYWRDEDKTTASFITHPITGEQLYKTGDLGRYLPDGNIEFLGREDFQVKINGYRVELGEIEAPLKQYPNVKEAVVTVVGESQLVAYVVSTNMLPLQEAYQPEGVMVDPVERIEFKLKQPGLRQLESSEFSIQLPKSEVLTQDYFERQSYRQFLAQPISLEKFSQFLSCLLQMKLDDYPLPKYRYPSAGSLYPVQTYLLIKPNAVESLEAGIYYYHPADHRLILLSPRSDIDSSVYGGNQRLFEQSAFSLFLIGKLSASAPMYGELAKDFCLLEAGHIGQLLMNTAPTHQIGLCPIGYLKFAELQNIFRLESNEVLLYSFVGGKIDLTSTKQWLLPNNTPISTQLRKYLQQKLPKYMVPSEYILLDALPLTANGKVDRKALPSPDITLNSDAIFTPPTTELEQTLAKIVQDLLEIEAVGIHNNFLALGMDSLKLVQLRNQLLSLLNVNVSMKQLLVETTNIAELALTVDEQLTLSKIKQKPLSSLPSDDKERIEL
ncbi:non-ribosomal peptide synthetase [Aetokthonos hydrillicola Thurmond2011]|jgi:amino acid adenylation domain-containing protein|uniref:Non-ribosomal peptide synthetase n=1 Tax=Aetokthonos hydrillicola Thurmond2011 TaxID=2712845 RepID=A0AAP5M8K7_9CYAN|nr:non-ribosomal peptide synthetase [Aetokthonos hydrillicola]MBO3457407.1 amino acid adenylation domain-containing protein [Aetokthonos hydrillicola CCALA 1050]MBW4589452.1 amino acid adenylation domain-containing protein [Aetokthonos hydrillicola CCALA 1050]MDR9893703.1 non-ribosomal peptide synthetase [Aetokthonos hydrillicola Thurmond2011]